MLHRHWEIWYSATSLFHCTWGDIKSKLRSIRVTLYFVVSTLSAISRQQRNALEILFLGQKSSDFRNSTWRKMNHRIHSNGYWCSICHNKSHKVTKCENNRIVSEFHHCEGSSWPTAQPGWQQDKWRPLVYIIELPCRREPEQVAEQVALFGDMRVPRIREVRDIEKREVGRLHCTA